MDELHLPLEGRQWYIEYNEKYYANKYDLCYRYFNPLVKDFYLAKEEGYHREHFGKFIYARFGTVKWFVFLPLIPIHKIKNNIRKLKYKIGHVIWLCKTKRH